MIIFCCSLRWPSGDRGHPWGRPMQWPGMMVTPSLQVRPSGVNKNSLTTNLHDTGMYAEIFEYILQNPECGYQVFSTKRVTLQTYCPPRCAPSGLQPAAPSSYEPVSQEQNSPGDTAPTYSHALRRRPRQPAHQPQYFISSKENTEKSLEFFFSTFFLC